MKKATKFSEIPQAVDFNIGEGITPEHPFFVDFSEVRGDFNEKKFYKEFNVNPKTYVLEDAASNNPKLVFLAGHRGSGKTTEINKYAEHLNNPWCFYCVICSLDTGLDINNIDFVDISIYMLEMLSTKLQKDKIKLVDADIKPFYSWYEQTIKEVTDSSKGEIKVSAEAKAGINILSIFKLSESLRASLSGTQESKDTIRRVFTNKFTDFAVKFQEFILRIEKQLRDQKKALKILFIIDGIEKAYSIDITRKIILDESNRLKLIKTNMLFTLPFGLMKEEAKLQQFSKVLSFPAVKVMERNGVKCEPGYRKFREFIYKRVDKALFDSEETVNMLIQYSGGSPRELLRLIDSAKIDAEEEKITRKSAEFAIKDLSRPANFLTKEELEKLREIKEKNQIGVPIYYDDIVDELMQKNIIFEYNDSTYKRVNPVIEASPVYKQYVG